MAGRRRSAAALLLAVVFLFEQLPRAQAFLAARPALTLARSRVALPTTSTTPSSTAASTLRMAVAAERGKP
jgi:hypothetical protein